MPDYNLGRAHGEILITADTRGVQEAQAAMASAAAEAEALDKSMGKVNKQFDENRVGSTLTAEQLVKQRGALEQLRVTHERYNQQYQDAARKREDIESRAQKAAQNQKTTLEQLQRLDQQLQRARVDEERTLERMNTAYERYQNRLALVRYEVERFNNAHLNATKGFRDIAREAEQAGRSLEQLEEKLSGVVKVLRNVSLYGLFGGAAGGSLGLLGGAGLEGVTVGIGGLLEVVKDFSGAMLLVPGVVQGAALSLGTLKVAFHGIAEELGALEDPGKFIQGLRELAPAAQQAMLTIQSFTYAFRGARDEVQQSLFAPIIADIQPLIQTWLPQLMNAGQQIANQFGQAFHQVFQIFQQPEVVKGFQTFVSNLVQGFQAARGAIQPFLAAWNTLANVGSGVFERLGKAIATVAGEFNSWVQNAAQSGQLLRLISAAVDGFTQLGHIIRDLGIGILNIFDVAAKVGGSFLGTIARIAEEFKNWTESAKGQSSLTNFFTLLHDSAEKVRPIIHDLAEGIAIIAGTLDRLGLAIQPGLVSFFDSLVKSLQVLGPAVQGMAPAINEFLKAFGQTLLQIVQEMGPQLPKLFESLANSLIELLKVLPPVASAVAVLMSHITPHQIEVVLSLIGAIKLFNGAIGLMNAALNANPIVRVVTLLGLLATAFVTAYDNSKEFHDAVDHIFDGLAHIGDNVVKFFQDAWKTVRDYWNGLTWEKLGSDAVHLLAQGIRSGIQSVIDAATDVGKVLQSFWHQKSPAEQGPLSETSSEQMGEEAVTQYAEGMTAATPSVAAASSGVAGTAAGGLSGGAGTGAGGGGTGFGPGGFTSAGIAGISGQGTVGGSGFDQWVNFITTDMAAWSHIFHGAFDLFKQISSAIVDSIKVVASIWNGGRNALTQQGGIAGPPAAAGQQAVPGVPSIPVYGPPPFDWGPKLSTPAGPQQQAGNVPLVGPGRTLGQGGAPGPSTPGPAPAGPTAGGAVPLVQRPDGTWTSSDPEWAKLIQRESSGDPAIVNKDPNDINTQRGDPSKGLFQFTNSTWLANGGGKYAPSADKATPQQQAEIAGNLIRANPSGSDWGAGRAGREDAAALVRGLAPAGGQVGTPQPAGTIPPIAPAQGTGPTSENKWSVLNASQVVEAPFGAKLAPGAPAALLGDFATWFNANIEPVTDTSSWRAGGAYDQQIGSQHISGTALDINPNDFPGFAGGRSSGAGAATHFSADQIAKIRAKLATYGGAIYWGEDFGGQYTDPMHFEITGAGYTNQPGGPTNPAVVAAYNRIARPSNPPASTTGDANADQGANYKDWYGGGTGDGGSLDPAALGTTTGIVAAPFLARLGRSAWRAGSQLRQTRGLQALLQGGAAPEDIEMLQQLIAEGRPGAQDALDWYRSIAADSGAPTGGLPGAPGIGGTPTGGRLPGAAPTPYASPQAAMDAIRARLRAQGIGQGAGVGAPPQQPRVFQVTPDGEVSEARPGARLGPRGTLFQVAPDGTVTPIEGGVPPTRGVYPGAPGLGPLEGPLPPPNAPPPSSPWEWRTGLGYGPPSRIPAIAPETGPVPVNPPASVTGSDPASITGDAGAGASRLGGLFRGAGSAVDALGILGLINQTGGLVGQLPRSVQGVGAVAAPTVIGGAALAGGAAAGIPLIPAVGGAGLLLGAATAFGVGSRGDLGAPVYDRTGNLVPPGFVLGPDDMPIPIGAPQGPFGPQAPSQPPAPVAPPPAQVQGQPPGQFIPTTTGAGPQGGPGTSYPRGWPNVGAAPANPPAPAPIPAVDPHGPAATFNKANGQWEQNGHPVTLTGPGYPTPRSPAPAPPPDPTHGLLTPPTGGPPATPVHVTNPQDLPGGTNSPTPTGLDKLATSIADQRKALGVDVKTGQPGPGQPGFIGPATAGERAQAAAQQPTQPHAGTGVTPGPAGPEGQPAGVPGGAPGQQAVPQRLPFTTSDSATPLDSFTGAMASIGNVASDAFQVFDDIIKNIQAVAAIGDTLVRGPENTEDIVKIITNLQTFLTTAADVAKTVGAVGSLVGGAGAGDPTGITGAVGSAISSIASIVSSAITAVNDSITLGIEIYHEVGKYAGFIFGGLLGGSLGTLGGNVHMLLNTRTGQIQAYSEDNPLNKNIINTPFASSYTKPPPAQNNMTQLNMYSGPGTSPMQMFQDSMWIVSTGAPQVASVAPGAD